MSEAPTTSRTARRASVTPTASRAAMCWDAPAATNEALAAQAPTPIKATVPSLACMPAESRDSTATTEAAEAEIACTRKPS